MSFDTRSRGLSSELYGGRRSKAKVVGVLVPPRSVQAGVAMAGIVGDDHNPSPGSPAGGAELLKKLKEAGCIEFAAFQTEHKAPIPQAHGPEIPHALAGGSMQ